MLDENINNFSVIALLGTQTSGDEKWRADRWCSGEDGTAMTLRSGARWRKSLLSQHDISERFEWKTKLESA